LLEADDLPSSFELTLGERAAIRVQSQESTRQANRERIAIEAILDARQDLHAAQNQIELTSISNEWVDRFWSAAQDISDAEMQTIWGRILSRHSTQRCRFGLRTLDFLSTLDKEEARKFQELASFVIKMESSRNAGVSILLEISPHLFADAERNREERLEYIGVLNKEIRRVVGDYKMSLFGPIGVFHMNNYPFFPSRDKFRARIDFRNKSFEIYGFSAEYHHTYHTKEDSRIGLGVGLNPLGIELLSLVDVPVDDNYASLVIEGLRAQGLRVDLVR
jgi:hypothetical protein